MLVFHPSSSAVRAAATFNAVSATDLSTLRGDKRYRNTGSIMLRTNLP